MKSILTSKRRVLAAALLSMLLIPFQNCGSKADLSEYGSNSSNSTAAPKSPVVDSSFTPANVAPFQGSTLSVAVSGEEPLSYQWYRNDAPIAGETKSALSFTETMANSLTSPSATARFKVTVKDKDGDEVSQEFPITVQKTAEQLVAASVTLPPDFNRQTCAQNRNQITTPLTSVVTGYKLTYAWKVTYGANLIDIIPQQSNAITPPYYTVLNGDGTLFCRYIYFGNYQVTVTDAFGNTASDNIIVNGTVPF